jgi:hypothetical protein
MARPRTVDATGKSVGTRLVALRITDGQYLKLSRKAKQKGCTISQLIRSELLDGTAA